MKKLILIIYVSGILLSCNDDNNHYSADFGKPYITDGETEIALCPTFGFDGMAVRQYGAIIETQYHFYCDTVHPPVNKMISTFDAVGYSRLPIEKRLLPNRNYYWKCIAAYNGHEVSSETCSFTTIDLSAIYGKHWVIDRVITTENYQKMGESHFLNYDIQDTLSFGDIYSFLPVKDSVFMITRAKDYTGYFPPKGNFLFSKDSMYIAGKSYRFYNFGYSTKRHHERYSDKLYLVLERHDRIMLIYDVYDEKGSD
ncbi:MAG: hypothetical protein LBF89_02270 [Bacteroidales bacterium]|jgi:hypothetical protein|nr:hypothetical protein [Bacteroidales bacterium]